MPISVQLSIALQNQDGSGDLSFFAYLDTWIIGGLVLLAVVVVTLKWIWGRIHRRDDRFRDDDYYTDDYYDDDEYDAPR